MEEESKFTTTWWGCCEGDNGPPTSCYPTSLCVLEGWSLLYLALWSIGENALPSLSLRIHANYYGYSHQIHPALMPRKAPLTPPTPP